LCDRVAGAAPERFRFRPASAKPPPFRRFRSSGPGLLFVGGNISYGRLSERRKTRRDPGTSVPDEFKKLRCRPRQASGNFLTFLLRIIGHLSGAGLALNDGGRDPWRILARYPGPDRDVVPLFGPRP